MWVYEGNPLGSITLGNVVFGQPGILSNINLGGVLAHEIWGHGGQYGAMGGTFLPLYIIQMPVALLVAIGTLNPLQIIQFNLFENYWLSGAPSTYRLSQ